MSAIPTQYQWLTKLSPLPRTIAEALKLLGTKEVVGKGSNRTILEWRDALNGAAPAGKPIVSGYSDDDIAWCGLFVAFVCFMRMKLVDEVVKAPLWAANWANYGVEVAKRVRGKLTFKGDLRPSLGDVLVFERPNGNHVAFYIAEDSNFYHVIGGNQSNAVTITRIAKDRCWAVRRPHYNVVPKTVKPYIVAASGAISSNEA